MQKGDDSIMKSKIGIIIAVPMEAEAILLESRYNWKMDCDGIYYSQNYPIQLMISGIGKVYATRAFYLLITNGCDKILTLGTCASLSNDPIGTIIHPTHYYEFDMNATGLKFDIGITPFDKTEREFIPKDWIKMKSKVIRDGLMSGDIFIHHQKHREFLIKEFQCAFVDMESGAIAKVAEKDSIPYSSIKIVSDNAQGEAGNNWDENVIKLSDKLNELLMELL